MSIPEPSLYDTITARMREAAVSFSETLIHREAVEQFDLSGFADQPEQTVHVTFGGWAELDRILLSRHAMPALAAFKEQATQPEYDALFSDVMEYCDTLIADTLEHKQQEGWSHTRKIGDVTVVFDEALTDRDHPANTLPKEGLINTLEQDGAQTLRNFSVNGRACSTHHDLSLLHDSLPGLVQWLDSVREVEQREEHSFAPCIHLDSFRNASVYPNDHQLTLGAGFLGDTDYGKNEQIFTLHHEIGHTTTRPQIAALTVTANRFVSAHAPFRFFSAMAA